MKLDELFNHHVAQACAKGLRTPVVAVIFPDAPAAIRAVLDAQERPEEADSFSITTWSIAEATKLLRQHAGLGGGARGDDIGDDDTAAVGCGAAFDPEPHRADVPEVHEVVGDRAGHVDWRGEADAAGSGVGGGDADHAAVGAEERAAR